MAKPLRVLLIEDSELDAELILRELRNGGYSVSHVRVQTADAMRVALVQTWDIVLCDYRMPQFSATAALSILKDTGLDIPFIMISGTIGDEAAVQSLKAGAHDFLVKGRLARLIPAVEREVREARIRRERREAVAQIEENERRLSAIFNQVAVGIVQTDLQARLISANQRFCDIVMRPLEQVIGLRIQDFTHPADALAISDVFARIAGGERNFMIEQRLPYPDGSHVWVNNTISAVAGSDGHPRYAVAIVQDITARKRAEEELILAVRARDEFLSIASHELKTPITALELQLASSLKLLRAQSPIAVEKMESKLSGATRQVDRLTVLINNLLDVTRITSGRLSLSRREVDLREIIQRVVNRSHEIMKRCRSELILHADDPVVGCWDPVSLEAVVNNLLSNAMKFGEGKPIEITAERTGDVARLAVADHGIGIAPDVQNRIFQRFERAVSSQHYGGFGIGLWITRQMVEAHGGTIQVSSNADAGSTFVVSLPVVV